MDVFNKVVDRQQARALAVDPSEAPGRIAQIYNEGIEMLRRYGFTATPTFNGPYAHHTILRCQQPAPVNGINYPEWFKPLWPISVFNLQKIERIFGLQAPELQSFFKPMYAPNTCNNDSPLHAYTEMLIRTEMAQPDKPFDYGISFDPIGTLSGIKPTVFHPRQWIPDASWFAPQIRELEFEDIFTIWPKAEANLLKFALGRICVGRSNHIPYGWSQPIVHTARIAVIVVGEDPGLGKSTIFNYLWHALTQCGYRISTFRSITERFGLEDPARADVAYKDDVVSSSLKAFIAAEETKIITTGGKLRVEDKFQKPIDIWPRAVLLLNTNEFDPQIAYQVDPGIVDRVKLLSTLRATELQAYRDTLGPLARQSPDLRPASHLPWLAEKLQCSIDAIMLWGARLATDYFYNLIAESTIEHNLVEEQVKLDTSYLRLTLDKAATRSFIVSLVFCYLVRHYDSSFVLPELNLALLATMLDDFYYLAVDPKFFNFRYQLKQDWNRKRRPELHPWVGIRKLQLATIRRAQVALYEAMNRRQPIDVSLKACFEQILLRSGFKLSQSVVWVISAWKSVVSLVPELIQLAHHFRTADYAPYADLVVERPQVNDSHLSSPLYNPRTIDKQYGINDDNGIYYY